MVDRSNLVYQLIDEKLQELARSKRIATYTVIARGAGIGARSKDFNDILRDVNRRENDSKRPPLSTLVIGINGLPGEGYFKDMRRFGLFDGTSMEKKKKFWVTMKHRVFDYWSRVKIPVAKKEARGILKVTMPVKGKRWIYTTVGVWQASNNRINIALPGKRFFCASKQPAGDRSHQLFGILKELLKENGRWKKVSS